MTNDGREPEPVWVQLLETRLQLQLQEIRNDIVRYMERLEEEDRQVKQSIQAQTAIVRDHGQRLRDLEDGQVAFNSKLQGMRYVWLAGAGVTATFGSLWAIFN